MLDSLAVKELSQRHLHEIPSPNLKLAILEIMVSILDDLPVTGVEVIYSDLSSNDHSNESFRADNSFKLSLQQFQNSNKSILLSSPSISSQALNHTISKRRTQTSEVSLSLENCKLTGDERFHYYLQKIESCILQNEALTSSAPKPRTKVSVISNSVKSNKTKIFSYELNEQKEHPAVAKAIKIISQRYKENFSMQDLASECCISPSRLSALLKQRFNNSFKKILTTYRIEKAKEIFSEMPTRQITQVCIDVGFYDLSHFEKTFKRYVGVSPRVYRDKFRPKLSTALAMS